MFTLSRRAFIPALLLLAACAGGVVAVTNPGNGVRVVDGDTLDWEGRRWRIAAIDTPERGEPGYAPARDRLKALVAHGVRCQPNGQEAQGRAVGSCFTLKGEDVAAVLAREGLAAVCHNRQEAPAYAAAERAAQGARLGLWASGSYRRKGYCPPPR